MHLLVTGFSAFVNNIGCHVITTRCQIVNIKTNPKSCEQIIFHRLYHPFSNSPHVITWCIWRREARKRRKNCAPEFRLSGYSWLLQRGSAGQLTQWWDFPPFLIFSLLLRILLFSAHRRSLAKYSLISQYSVYCFWVPYMLKTLRLPLLFIGLIWMSSSSIIGHKLIIRPFPPWHLNIEWKAMRWKSNKSEFLSSANTIS